jgi:DNA-binding GntR family transcriptional regulator
MPVPAAHGVHKRSLLRDDVYESIRNAIVEGTLAPGERLKDPELEAWLGVSRTPIREALLRLERAGLVIAQPGRATTVAPYDLASTVNAQQVAASLHELAARLAVPALTDADLAALTHANARFSTALSHEDADAALDADDDFHEVFLEASGNAMIRELLEHVIPLLRRAEKARFSSFSGRDSVAQHASIIDAARSGDAERAAKLSRENWLSLGYVASA